MNPEDFRKIERQLEQANFKIDTLARMMTALINELGVNQGKKMSNEIDEILQSVRGLSRDINQGEVRTISFRMDTIKKSIEQLHKPVGYG